jgi:hypothetical protein
MSLRPPPASRNSSISDGGISRPATRLEQVLRAATPRNATGKYNEFQWNALCEANDLSPKACAELKKRAQMQEEMHDKGKEDVRGVEEEEEEEEEEESKRMERYAQRLVEKKMTSDQRIVNRFVEELYLSQRHFLVWVNSIANSLKNPHPDWNDTRLKQENEATAIILTEIKSFLERTFVMSFTIPSDPARSALEERMQADNSERNTKFIQGQLDTAIEKIRLAQRVPIIRLHGVANQLQNPSAGEYTYRKMLGENLNDIVLKLKKPFSGYPFAEP